MKKSSAVLVAALAGAASSTFTGCGTELGTQGDGQELGRVSFALVVPGGPVLDSVTYTIGGPAGFSRTGSFDVSHSANISGLITLPAGGPYSVTLDATSTLAGGGTCGGTGTFSVVAHGTTGVSVHMTCHEVPKNGTVLLSGAINVCPTIDNVSATPDEIAVGYPLMLSASAHDSDAAPTALTYAWTTTGGGTFGSAAASDTPFTCTMPGTASITLTVSDGDPTPGCADTRTVTVGCVP
jgi:hypothetical protein